MQLQELTIRRQPSYCDDAGKLVGAIKFSGGQSESTLKLSEAKATQILMIMADAIEDSAVELADTLRGDLAKGLLPQATLLPAATESH